MLCIYALVVITATIIALISAWSERRRTRTDVVLHTLAAAVSQNLPLPAVLRAASAGEDRRLRQQYVALAAALERGLPLSTALARSLGGCPAEVLGAVRGAEEGGTLSAVLASVMQRLRRQRWRPAERTVSRWYLLVMLLVVPTVVTFMLAMIVPRMAAIFADFETALPPLTTLLLDTARVAGENAPVIGAVLALIALLAIARPFIRRRPGRVQPLHVVVDSLIWRLPIIGRLAEHAGLADQLLVIQASIGAGRDIEQALRHGACVATNTFARRRLIRLADALRGGAPAFESARRIGFPTPVVRCLAAAKSDADLASGLAYLADYYGSLYDHRRRVLINMGTPLLVGGWAIIVGFMVVALMMPLITLIQSVTDTLD